MIHRNSVYTRMPVIKQTAVPESVEVFRSEMVSAREDTTKLRVGILVNSFTQPSWIHKITEDIVRSSFAEIALIIDTDASGTDSSFGVKQWPGIGHWAIWGLYSWFDNFSPTPYRDPCVPLDITPLVQGCPIVRILPVSDRQRRPFSGEEAWIFGFCDIDVLLDFSNTRLDDAVIRMSKFGVWSANFSKNLVPSEGPPGFWELLGNEAAIEFSVLATTYHQAPPQVVYRSWTSTDLCSVKGTRSKVYWKSATAVVRTLRNLHQRGPASFEEERSVPVPLSQRAQVRRGSNPTSGQMLLFLGKLVKRKFFRRLRNISHLEQWYLGYTFDGESGPFCSFGDVNCLKPPPGRYWADPFPIEKEGKYYIFFEEFLYKEKKGRIAVLEMDDKGAGKQSEVILQRDYHLSYPFLFEWRGNLYMIPETKRNSTIELYRCVSFPCEWKLEKVLIEQVQAVDSTLYELEGIWWLFCCIGGRDFASNDELHLFHSDSPLGPWTAHIRNPVKSDVRSSRPAGKLFQWDGHLYRPSQDCSVRMGGAMCINRVTNLTRENYREEVVTRIEPNSREGIYGTHTLNRAGRLIVTDYFGYVRKHFSS